MDYQRNGADLMGAIQQMLLAAGAAKKLGIDWTLRASADDTASWRAVSYGGTTFGGSMFLAVGASGKAMKSADGISWTSINTGPQNLAGIACNGSLFVVAANGTNRGILNYNGSVWNTNSPSENNNWAGICFDGTRFVAVATDGTNRVAVSTNGTSWTNYAAAAAKNWNSVAAGNGVLIAVADQGDVMKSSDGGASWASKTPTAMNAWSAVAYGNGVFVAVSYSGTNRVMYSEDDGETWTGVSVASNAWFALCHDGSQFIAVATSGTNRVMTSPDGKVWTPQSAAAANQWIGITFGNSKLVAVSTDGTNRVMTSP